MILLWHEGTLGDLLLARVACPLLATKGDLFLAARNEARFLFQRTGWVKGAYPTSFQLAQVFSPEEVFVFSRSLTLPQMLEETFASRVKILPSRPAPGRHLSEEILAALGAEVFPEEVTFPWKRNPQKGRVLLHPGSGGRFKCAPPDFWKKLYHLLEETGFSPIIVLGPAEEELIGAFSPQEVVFSQDMGTALYLLEEAQAFIGHDSGLTHLAAALGCPTVAIFGPTDWRSWSPFGERVLILVKDCLCLRERRDPRLCEEHCLSRISANEVAHRFSHWLAFPEAGQKAPLPGQRILHL